MTVKTKRDRAEQERELESRLPEYGSSRVSFLTDEDLGVLLRVVTREVAVRQVRRMSGEPQAIAVRIFGPNLSGPAQKKGTFHVHAHGCEDCSKYGPGKRFQGDDNGWGIETTNRLDVVEEVYHDQLNEQPEDQDREEVKHDWLSDFHFAPCLKSLPVEAKS